MRINLELFILFIISGLKPFGSQDSEDWTKAYLRNFHCNDMQWYAMIAENREGG